MKGKSLSTFMACIFNSEPDGLVLDEDFGGRVVMTQFEMNSKAIVRKAEARTPHANPAELLKS